MFLSLDLDLFVYYEVLECRHSSTQSPQRASRLPIQPYKVAQSASANASNGSGIDQQVTGQLVSWFSLIKAMQGGNLSAHLTQAFLFNPEHVINIATRRLNCFKVITNNTLVAT